MDGKNNSLIDIFNDERATLFVDVILPVPLPRLYTYRVPFDANELIKIGVRVIVQFGKKKIYTGIVANIHSNPPKVYEAKMLLDILDREPIVVTKQLELFKWISTYYMCTIGEVMNAAVPSGLKLSSESRIQFNPHIDLDEIDLNEYEHLVIASLKKNESMSYDQIADLVQKKGVNKLIKSLIDKDVVLLFEKIKDKYSPKKIKKIRLNELYTSQTAIPQLFETLEKHPKQLDVLMKYLQKVPLHSSIELNAFGIEKSTLINEGISNSPLKTLVKNEVFEEFEIIVSRFNETYDNNKIIELSTRQEQTRDEILNSFSEKEVTLLHGLTGSGKTEIYIDLIQTAIENGTQVLLLLPEIALTTQIVSRLRKVFGSSMAVYHSRYSENERVEVYKNVIADKHPLVVGVRSSIFLPFQNLGLIIIDEEHDSSYKQHEPSPRYNARDTALVLAKLHNAKVLLGSATPSVESYYHAQSGRWGFVELFERFGNAQMPEIIPVDLKVDHHNGSNFTRTLIDAIAEKITLKEQIILFQNRRGYSPYIECSDCKHTIMCDNCNVSLTYHMHNEELRCHYCSHHQAVPTNCEACGSPKLLTQGFGTERIEESLQIHFPNATIQRMDLDTTRKKNSYQQIIDDFTDRKIDILVGTQMITKGLDFDNVNLVGVFDIDRMLFFPDFRAQEKTFQMLTQVSGRAGRKEKKGRVIVQTSNTANWVINNVVNGNMLDFYKREINEREEFSYPPFSRIIKISVKNDDRLKSNAAGLHLANLLRRQLGEKVLGPEEPGINRIRNLFITDIVIKLDRGAIDIAKVKEFIQLTINEIRTHTTHKKCLYIVDVDPL